MRVITFLLLLLFFLSANAQLYREDIHFKYRSSALTAENLVEIKRIWERLPLNCAVELKLISEKEMRKIDPGAQTTLTLARATEVKRFLTTQKMVDPYDIEFNTNNFVEEEKIHNTSASFKRIVRNPYKVYSVVLTKEVPICYNLTDAEKNALSSKEPTVYTISTEQDQLIEGPCGTIVLIPAHSFVLPENKLSADVKIKLWEFTSMEDILAAGLTTASNGRMLETGGMIYISAEHEGRCLRLLRNSRIIIKFLTHEKQDSMRLFKGIPLPRVIEWKRTNVKDDKYIYPKSIKPVPPDENKLPSFDAEGPGGSFIPLQEDSLPIEYYVFESSGLGWINCDKFYNIDVKINVAFNCPAGFSGFAGLVFTSIRSVMPGEILPGKNYNAVEFQNVPKGMEAVLLFYAFSKDKKKVYYASQKMKLGEKPKEDAKFREVPIEQFRSTLSSLRSG